MKTASALAAWLLCLSAAQAQGILPNFKPVQPRYDPAVVPAAAKVPGKMPPIAMPAMDKPREESDDYYVPTDLPGPQRLFRRDSEPEFFERIAQDVKRQSGGRAMFPPDPVVTREPYRPRNFPSMTELVEPCYVCHSRLLFEQPNFERAGYNFGVLTPGICLGVFYYDTLMLPYHICSDLRYRDDCSVGKCLPGDPAPFRVTCERFSVTGLVGQASVVTGFGMLFP